MPKAKEAPFLDEPNIQGRRWSLNWYEWLRDEPLRINERPEIVGDVPTGNIVITNLDGDLVDGGVAATEDFVDDAVEGLASETYVGDRYLTENLLREAGLEEGARFGSFRIGLLTENDFVFFDENGKIILYGVAGIQLIVPLNADAPERFAVFDSVGNLKYRTAEQLADDLDEILASRNYVSNTFILENLLPEAGTEPGFHFGSYKIGRDNDNCAEFEEDGTYKFNGDATVFNDIQFSLSTARVPAANAPSWDTFSGNLKKFTFAINDFIDLEAKEIPHSYKSGSDYEWHIHIFTNGLDGTDRTIKYQIEYAITDTDAVISVLTVSQQFTIPANTTDLTHLKLSIPGNDGTGIVMEDDITVQFKRIATDTGVNPTSDPFVSMVGIHYEVDTVGSRTENVK